jgi:hypothetical protein
MSDSETDFRNILKNPYCDDPQWQEWHANATDVQGGADDDTTTEEEEEEMEEEGAEGVEGGVQLASLPGKCICGHCRLVFGNFLINVQLYFFISNFITNIL